MSEDKMKEVIEYLPNASQVFPVQDDHFLFFFEPKLMDVKRFLFCLSLKTGTQIFSVIMLIQAISSFLDIFSGSFLGFFAKIIAFGFYFVAGFYTLVSTLKDEYLFARVGYLFISIVFLFEYLFARVGYLFISIVFLFNAFYFVCKTFIDVIEFITPWDSKFLQLGFLIDFFGYGIFLFIYLYMIYVLYHFMLELKNPNVAVESNNVEENQV